jgi:ADP-ribose pyrophosphatase YjhB (NUDIX family)
MESPAETRFAVNVEAAIHREANGESQWLMVRRSDQEEHAGGDLAMPGGTVESENLGSDPLEITARREVSEEVAVTIGELTYVRSDGFTTASGTPVLNVVMLAAYHSGEPRAVDPSEVASVEWMTLAEIADHPYAQAWTIESMRRAEQVRRTQLGSSAIHHSQA